MLTSLQLTTAPPCRCDKCSLSGEGTIDGHARRWLATAPTDGRSGRQIQAADALQDQAMLSVLQEQGQEEALQASGDDPPRKAVRNWRDSSCPNPDECRCGRGGLGLEVGKDSCVVGASESHTAAGDAILVRCE